mgnify:CR=1 FL=1
MATILDQYLEKQNTIRSQIAENSLPPEDLLIMQELNYRICVLETFQSFLQVCANYTGYKGHGLSLSDGRCVCALHLK